MTSMYLRSASRRLMVADTLRTSAAAFSRSLVSQQGGNTVRATKRSSHHLHCVALKVPECPSLHNNTRAGQQPSPQEIQVS